MSFRLAINGYGRIGQCVLRALYENGYRKSLEIVAINELSDLETLTYLTRYDTSHGRFPASVSSSDGILQIDDDAIFVMNQKEPESIDWRAMNLDLILECSGSFKDRATAEIHLKNGAPRLLFSHPAKPDVDATIVYGVNQDALRKQHRIVSAASCSTNCIIPVIKTLNDILIIEYGSIMTIHSAMNDQPVIDAYNKQDMRLTRSALQSIIPVDTELAKGIDRLLPALSGCFVASSIRVPTTNVSCIDLCVHVKKSTSVTEVNQLIVILPV